jgi:Flp pilus assembly protein TadG
MKRPGLFRDQSGQTLVFAALGMVVLISFLGLAIDVGHLRYARRHLQTAADAAALAAGLEIRVCGSLSPCPAMTSAAEDALVENGYSGKVTVLNQCVGTVGTTLTLTINIEPCALGAADPNHNKQFYVEVEVSQPVSTWFASVIGFSTVPMTARAEARRGGAPCIYALDPTGAGAITLAAGLSSTCGVVDESNNTIAATCVAGIVTAPRIDITGGGFPLLCSVTPAANTKVPVPSPADPLAYLQPYFVSPIVPDRTKCGAATSLSNFVGSANQVSINVVSLLLSGPNIVFHPGTYCGGISIVAALGANITFMPGVYTITSQGTFGGLTITASVLSAITGTGVTFYNYGPFGGLNLVASSVLSSINLSAPSSGDFSGILYYQDPGNNTLAVVTVPPLLSTGVIQGGYYIPSASLNYVLATPGSYSVIVAKDINFVATATINDDFSSLTNGSPINGDYDQLVQ